MDSLKQLTETLFKRMEKKDLTSSGEFTLPLGCGEYLEETATGHAYRFPLGLAIENGLPDHGDVLLTGVESIYPARLLMSSSTTVILETEAPIPEEDLCAFLSLRVDPYQIPNQVTGPHYAKKAETAGPVLDKADIDPMFFRNNHYFSPEAFHALTAERLCDMGVGVVTEGEVTGDLMRMILRFLRNNRSVLVVTDTAAKGDELIYNLCADPGYNPQNKAFTLKTDSPELLQAVPLATADRLIENFKKNLQRRESQLSLQNQLVMSRISSYYVATDNLKELEGLYAEMEELEANMQNIQRLLAGEQERLSTFSLKAQNCRIEMNNIENSFLGRLTSGGRHRNLEMLLSDLQLKMRDAQMGIQTRQSELARVEAVFDANYARIVELETDLKERFRQFGIHSVEELKTVHAAIDHDRTRYTREISDLRSSMQTLRQDTFRTASFVTACMADAFREPLLLSRSYDLVIFLGAENIPFACAAHFMPYADRAVLFAGEERAASFPRHSLESLFHRNLFDVMDITPSPLRKAVNA